MKRINESLIERGYVTWFDLTNMKGELQLLSRSFAALHLIGLTLTGCDAGSTMDAMSDAIEGADVMLYGVSLACKSFTLVCHLSKSPQVTSDHLRSPQVTSGQVYRSFKSGGIAIRSA